MEVDNGQILTATSLSLKPPIFEIKDFLSVSECGSLVELAQKSGLEESVTLDDNEGSDEERLREINDFSIWDKNKNSYVEVSEVRLIWYL